VGGGTAERPCVRQAKVGLVTKRQIVDRGRATGPNPSGLCMCGCGRKTKIVTKSDKRHGHVMGHPFRFIHGHSSASEGKGPNRFKLRRGTALIFLERRDGTVLECSVSRKDFDRVRIDHWFPNENGKGAFYAAAWIDGVMVHMHKHLYPSWALVNHENGNGLDNRRENLRGVRRGDLGRPTWF
jgi:hypothetical protein